MEFNHFILTRFNILFPLDVFYPRKVYEDVKYKHLNLSWLDKRVKYFETYCLPSVLSQTNDNFKWLIFCHSDTPDIFKEKINSYSSKKIEIVYTKDSYRSSVPSALLERINNKSFIIQTQLDSDDALCKYYIQNVQNSFRGEVEFLNPSRGYMLYNGKIYGRVTQSPGCNPFFSFVEKNTNNLLSLYSTVHGAAHTVAPVRRICEKESMWIQVVHANRKENLLNKPALKSKDKGRDLKEIENLFGLDISKIRKMNIYG